ncbi:hypothetical protein [Tumebacillus avium]|nr:hypothetical protein [Tumebacillus avium]
MKKFLVATVLFVAIIGLTTLQGSFDQHLAFDPGPDPMGIVKQEV